MSTGVRARTRSEGGRPIEDLHRLIALCPSPPVPARPAAEAGRYAVPESHRELVGAYGVGCFDEFLWIYGSGAHNPHLDIDTATDGARAVLHDKRVPGIRNALKAYGLGPGDLVQWGGTDNGDTLLWVPAGPPEAWPTIAVAARQFDFAVLERSSTGIVLDVLTGAARIGFFPDDFPSSHPQFAVNPYT